MAKRINVPEYVRTLVAEYLFEHEGAKAREIKRAVEIKYKEHKFTERTYQNIISKLSLPDSALDQTWTILSLSKPEFALNPAVLPKIFELKNEGMQPEKLTIRGAIWMSRLCMLPVSPGTLWLMGSLCAIKERISEAIGDSYPKNFDLDQYLQYMVYSPGVAQFKVSSWEINPQTVIDLEKTVNEASKDLKLKEELLNAWNANKKKRLK